VVSFAPGPIRGEIAVPGDKSISHRALILSAFGPEPLEITDLNPGRDVRATLEGLRCLEAALRQAQGDSAALRQAQGDTVEVDCMNSGSTTRMLLGVCAGANVHARFDGDDSLRRRPMEPVAAQLRAFGARIDTTDGHLPMEIFGCPRVQTRSFILLSPSAQIKSALLFAGLFAGVAVDITGDTGSRDHTERMLRFEGAAIEWDGRKIALISPPTQRKPIRVPGDFSAAAFFITAATIAPQSEILVRNVNVNPTRTGLLDALRSMGAQIELHDAREESGEPVADINVRSAPLNATEVGPELALRAIDEIPLVAVAAAFAKGETRIRGIADLQTKESDRLAAIARLLSAVEIQTRPIPGGIAIAGGPPTRANRVVETHRDHRIAMAAAVLATAAGPIAVDEAASLEVSFPAFLQTLEQVRAS
jgi:3-phosphoshikimate 1-carboxyvinyltransferase